MRSLLIVVTLLGLAAREAVAQERNLWPGSEMLRHCRDYVAAANGLPTSIEPEDAAIQGMCAGLFVGVMAYGRLMEPKLRFCPPNGATSNQATQVVVRFLESRPDQLHEDLRVMAIKAALPNLGCCGEGAEEARGNFGGNNLTDTTEV